MAPEFLILRILLVFLLRELDYSSAFPIGRSLMHPEPWQKREVYGYGNRRPLQYIRSLRQAHRKPSFSDQVPIQNLEKPQENSLRARSFSQIQNEPDLWTETQSLHLPWTEQTTESTAEISAPQRTPVFTPRSFQFNLSIPFASFPDVHKGKTSNLIVSDFNSDVKDGTADFLQSHRPTSVQISSSFNSPVASDSVSGKGSSKDPNGGQNIPDVIKPTFQLSLSVPIPPPTPSPKPSAGKVDYPENVKIPEASSFVQSTYMEPTYLKPHLNQVEPEWVHTQYQPDELIHPAVTLQYPSVQPGNVFHGYYSSQNPTNAVFVDSQNSQTPQLDATNSLLSPQQYESAPSGHYSASQVKPSGSSDGQLQTWQYAGTQLPLPFPSKQHNYGQFGASFGQNVEAEPQQTPVFPSSPTIVQSNSEIPPSGYYSGETATSYVYGQNNMVQIGQAYLSSQYSKDQSGRIVMPNHPTTSDPTSNFQHQPTDYQTQIGTLSQPVNREQPNGKPKYIKLLIHVDDETDQDRGQHNSFAAPVVNQYSGWMTAELPNSNPSSNMHYYSQTSGMDHGRGQYTYHPQQQLETGQMQTPEPFSGQAYHAQNVGANAGSVQTNINQQQWSEATLYNMQDTGYARNGHSYQLQPSESKVERNYLVSSDGKQQMSSYDFSHYTYPSTPQY
ncbi:uncharacterized protein LOC121515615 [Cheilinus undulatus]|uniref:uncharacterized protein LOC121515615 n=1 Tax=Cheilinus undulatus TaxID=241271 RepID=UPI001BD1BD08|nr:uncharacterized protein LOC121515615 [Cheilinus undulatus]